jgi:nucleoside-diphosphate-sugar epimerase
VGGSGFVGRSLVEHLRGLKIETIALSSGDLDLSRPEAVETLRGILRENDSVVIVSAITPDKGKDIRTLMRNLEMGEHLCAVLENSGCAHVVYISSDAVYHDNANPVRENSSRSPGSFHGLMHAVREQMLGHALRRLSTPILILRPSLLYGAGDTHNGYGPNRFLRTALAEHKITLFGSGEEKRDHVYIKDVNRLIGLCLYHRTVGALNVATGTSTSFFEVAKTIARLFPRDEITIECQPRAAPVTHRHFDVTAMLKAFPSFHCTPLLDGLLESFQSITGGNAKQS